MEDKSKNFERKPNRPHPRHTLEEASIIANAIQQNNAGKPMNKLLVADAIGLKPSGVEFRDLLSSSFKYSLTVGTEKADSISLTELGQKFTKPLSPEKLKETRKIAAMAPETFGKIFNHFKNSKFPSGQFFENQLEIEFKVPREYVKELNNILIKNGQYANIIRDISGSPHVMLEGGLIEVNPPEVTTVEESKIEELYSEKNKEDTTQAKPIIPTEPERPQLKPIFIAHGKNKQPFEQLKRILDQFKIPYIATVDEPHKGRAISQKVRELMQSCGSAMFIFSKEGEPSDGLSPIPNSNVLYELGAASLLYGDKIIMFKEESLSLPSNINGFGYISFEENKLDAKAFEVMKELVALGFVKFVPT